MNLSLAELEAAAIFLRERLPLWRTHARIFGVADPDHLPQELARAHGRKVKAEFDDRKRLAGKRKP